MRRAPGLYDKHLPEDFLVGLDKTELDDRVNDGGEADAAKFLIVAAKSVAYLFGQDAGNASLA